jgi:hypothetical protein
MESEKNFIRSRLRPKANKSFEHFGDRRRCNGGSERDDCGFDASQRWRIPFILQTAAFIGSHEFRRCAL